MPTVAKSSLTQQKREANFTKSCFILEWFQFVENKNYLKIVPHEFLYTGKVVPVWIFNGARERRVLSLLW